MKINLDITRIKDSLSGNEIDYAPSINAVKTKTDSIDNSITNINNKFTWKLLKSKQPRAQAVAYPSGAKELFFAIRTDNSNDPMIPCHIPIIAKPSSGTYKYRIGYYFIDGVSGAVVVAMEASSFYITDTYSGGAFKSGATVDIYYR